MEVLLFILPFALLISAIFLLLFIKSINSGQYDDLETPAYRILIDDHSLTKIHYENQDFGLIIYHPYIYTVYMTGGQINPVTVCLM